MERKLMKDLQSVIFRILLAGAISICVITEGNGQERSAESRAVSEWVYMNKEGKLEYKRTERGDRIMDFSHAGYMGGGVSIPDVPVAITIKPSGADDTGLIQEAIDRVSGMPLKGNFRGAILLAPGNYNISRPILISESGVVLRGSGESSIINLSGKPFNAITVRGRSNDRNEESPGAGENASTTITDKYVPSGTSEFTVADAGKFKPGDIIMIRKPVTEKWIVFMKMHDLVRDGKPQTWIREGSLLNTERRIVKISGNRIFIDVPLSDSFNSEYLDPPGIIVENTGAPARITQSGVEKLKIVSPPQPVSHTVPHFTALRMNGEDCWARDLRIEETMNSVAVGGKRITVQNVIVERKALHQGSSRPAEFAPNGSQVLIDRCKVIADNVWFIATGSGQAGPIVILNCEFTGDQRAESHQRWSTGMLYDNVKAVNGGIDFRNRGSMGSGHGWSMGWGVAWNCTAKDFIIQDPPGAHNWMIGCTGKSQPAPRPFDKEPMLAEGLKDSPGKPVTPESLYLTQLEERLGKQALKNIGY